MLRITFSCKNLFFLFYSYHARKSFIVPSYPPGNLCGKSSSPQKISPSLKKSLIFYPWKKVGFSVNSAPFLFQSYGLEELERGYNLENSMRRILCAMVLLGNHLIMAYVLGTGEGDLKLADRIVTEQLQVFGSLFLISRLRYYFKLDQIDYE